MQWEKQVAQARKETKEQFDRLAQDQPSAVSDLSETIYTNGSEVEAIGIFGKNDTYGRRIGDSFTLGNNTQEFEPIEEFEPVADAPYNVAQFAEDDTFDNTYDSRQTPNYPIHTERPDFISNGMTEDSAYSNPGWGDQGSYRVQGLETGSDIVGSNRVRSFTGGSNRVGSFTGGSNRVGSFTESSNRVGSYRGGPSRPKAFRNGVAEGDSYSEDGDASTYKKGTKYTDDFDIPEPTRTSPIIVLYDTILSHPVLTCFAFPCIPCLAICVKSVESSAPPLKIRKSARARKSMRSMPNQSRDESTFAEYNANRVWIYFVLLLFSIILWSSFNICFLSANQCVETI